MVTLPVYGVKKGTNLPKSLVGMVFGNLTVEELVLPSGPQTYMCRCACGTIKPVKRRNLVAGARSCGCLARQAFGKKAKLRPYESTYNTLRYVNEGRYSVDLSYEQFLSFVSIKNCHYCGRDIVWREHISKSHGYNLDRKDNNKCYSVENCVVCCSRCNKGKSDSFSYDEWYQMTKCLREK